VTALALGDEHALLSGAEVLQAQPEDLAAAQPAQQHRLDHGLVAPRAQCGHQRIDLLRVDHARQRARDSNERHASPGPVAGSAQRQAARHRIPDHPGVASDDQVLIEPRDRGQTALDGARRQTRLPVLDPHDRRAPAGRPLARDEGQHVGGGDLGRIRLDDREEHLQIERGGQHGIPPGTASDELQKGVEERVTEVDLLSLIRPG
jgi:hypothetical protein